MKLEDVLQKHFNYSSFRIGQKEIISSILGGNHTIAMLPTGTGKSLCYQLPGYLLKGKIVIVSPLLSLMQDQVEQMMMNGEKRVIAFNSFLSHEEKYQALHQLRKYKFIFLSPEMLRSDQVINKLKEIGIDLFVIDEAHCISQWGYDFRPDYNKLGEIRERLGSPLTLALTATATPEVKDDIITSLKIEEWEEYIYSVDRPNISLVVENIRTYQEKTKRMVELITSLEGPGIIYFSSKKLSEQMASLIKEIGFSKIAAYHGGLEQETRILIQQQFIQGQLDVICATSAFGMGINKDNIRYVIHFHMPLQLESYLQEIGRAGRDGKQSLALLLYSPGDEHLPNQLIEGELPGDAQIDWLYDWLIDHREALYNLSLFESEIRRISGFTDNQWRMVEAFLQFNDGEQIEKTIDQLKKFINERMLIKLTKIQDMYRWTQLTDCRRKKILNYFNEEKTIEMRNCCDCCGVDYSGFYSFITKEPSIKIESSFHWKNHLAEILLSERKT
ncbi:ATP-dependent DNA helicase RecQ [Bacillus sp. FJAT-49705]|uniref:ATP-dependent DNA helicase RecQ n=1 Tax=Cytobacillus citreus TaxID=2833586 RepID=A0ABS5NTB0_9BACI|nr:ATP-dependent DNA helicase RecQ [Cytobacillus citreus]MBS4191072.1 ATP-dependent DNA helicase RecQ [Cytobacillus citreus]